jgi:hypothetical protein
MGDFLKKDVETPLYGCYLAAGARLRIETNSESILAIARANLEPSDDGHDQEEVRLKLWVEDEHSQCPATKPYFRGLGHLVFSGYDDRSSLLIDLRNRCGAGRFTQALARNPRYWKTAVFPSLLGIVGPSVGLTSLHCACVSWKGKGLLLAGGAGAGKSTLSLALAQAGLDFLSDDRTLVRSSNGKLLAFGLSHEMKQRADAVVHFPGLRSVECETFWCDTLWKGEPALRFDPVQLLGVTRAESCEPCWIVFLERQADPIFQLEEVAPEEAAMLLEQDLHLEMPEASQRQRLTVRALSQKFCYRLRYGGGDPHAAAGALRQLFIEQGSSNGSTQRPRDPHPGKTPLLSSDPLRRFRVTSLRSDVFLMGRHLRIETDSPVVMKRILETFNTAVMVPKGSPQFLWRIACEARQEHCSSWPALTAFCKGPLRYINLGQFSFVAADLEAREAVGVLPENLCEDEIGFSTVFLASLLHLTAPALGLTPISAACVSRNGNGLLLFGPPNSGKTTASYWGKKLGLEFHADQAAFLELDGGSVYAWGEFWPAAFRPETIRFLPELEGLSRSFQYRDRTLLCVDKSALSGANRGRVTPAACIFLERQASSPPRLIPLSHWEIPKQTFTDAGSDEDRNAILALLGKVPAYRLLYGDDPSIAARFFRSVLQAHQLMEQRI